jgi:hypothetical protein
MAAVLLLRHSFVLIPTQELIPLKLQSQVDTLAGTLHGFRFQQAQG